MAISGPKTIAMALLLLATGVATAHGQFAGDRVQVELDNQSKITFTELEISQEQEFSPISCYISHKVVEGALPLAPGQKMTVQFALCGPVPIPSGTSSKGDVSVELNPACPPGVCDYSARCPVDVPIPWPTRDGHKPTPWGTWVLGAPESTVVGPVTSCKKAPSQ